jgi:glycerol-3-phosphate dehydrogenase
MAEDCVNQAAKLAGLDARPCTTHDLKIHGYTISADSANPLGVYGADASAIEALTRENPASKEQLHSELPYVVAEVIWAARQEMARTVEDVLARRTRSLFLNAKAAIAMAERVAELLAGELGRDQTWQQKQVAEFRAVAQGYIA